MGCFILAPFSPSVSEHSVSREKLRRRVVLFSAKIDFSTFDERRDRCTKLDQRLYYGDGMHPDGPEDARGWQIEALRCVHHGCVLGRMRDETARHTRTPTCQRAGKITYKMSPAEH